MKQALVLIFGIACLTLLLAGCEGDQGPAGPPGQAKLYFGLEFYVDWDWDGEDYIETEVIRANFSMPLSGEVPSVAVNDVAMSMYIDDGAFEGYLSIPPAESITWSVGLSDRSISGTMQAPITPETISCNGIELIWGEANYFEPQAQYVFSWTGGSYDYCTGWFEYRLDDFWFEERYGTDGTSVSFSAGSDVNRMYFGLTALRGVFLLPGARPNITSDWADGYVSWYSRWKGFSMYPQGTPLKTQNDRSMPPMEPLRERLAAVLP